MPDKSIGLIHCVDSLTPNSGVTPVIYESLLRRKQEGLHSCCVYFTGSTPANVPAEIEGLVRAIPRPRAPWKQLSMFRENILELADAFAHDGKSVMIHDHGMWLPSNVASSQAAKALGCPYVVSPHGMLQPAAIANTGIKKIFAWFTYEKHRMNGATLIHAASTLEASAIRHKVPNARIATIPFGVVVPSFAAPPPQGARKKEVLYLGRIHPLKGIDLLVQAWKEAALPGWKLRLVGPCDEPYQVHLANLIRSLDLGSSIELEGARYGDDKSAILCQSSIFILPSYSENFGVAVGEALAHQLPVIATDKTPWTDIPLFGCGWVTTPNVAHIGQTLRSAMMTPADELARMGSLGSTWIKERFDPATLTHKMNDCYLELCRE